MDKVNKVVITSVVLVIIGMVGFTIAINQTPIPPSSKLYGSSASVYLNKARWTWQNDQLTISFWKPGTYQVKFYPQDAVLHDFTFKTNTVRQFKFEENSFNLPITTSINGVIKQVD